MTNTNSIEMKCDYNYTSATENDAIPMFHIDLFDQEDGRNAIIVITVADAINILKAWYEHDPATVFRCGYERLSSICWYDEDPVNNMSISAGDSNRMTFWLSWDYCTQLIEALQNYVYYCAVQLGGH